MSEMKHKKLLRHAAIQPMLEGKSETQLVYEGEDRAVAVVYHYETSRFIQNACNAHDGLLAACERISAAYHRDQAWPTPDEMGALRDAIAKAKGRLTMSRMEHTPLPLAPELFERILDARGTVIGCIYNRTGGHGVLTIDQQEERRAFIIRACNSHDALLAACEEALEKLDHLTSGSHHNIRQAIADAKPPAESATTGGNDDDK